MSIIKASKYWGGKSIRLQSRILTFDALAGANTGLTQILRTSFTTPRDIFISSLSGSIYGVMHHNSYISCSIAINRESSFNLANATDVLFSFALNQTIGTAIVDIPFSKPVKEVWDPPAGFILNSGSRLSFYSTDIVAGDVFQGLVVVSWFDATLLQ